MLQRIYVLSVTIIYLCSAVQDGGKHLRQLGLDDGGRIYQTILSGNETSGTETDGAEANGTETDGAETNGTETDGGQTAEPTTDATNADVAQPAANEASGNEAAKSTSDAVTPEVVAKVVEDGISEVVKGNVSEAAAETEHDVVNGLVRAEHQVADTVVRAEEEIKEEVGEVVADTKAVVQALEKTEGKTEAWLKSNIDRLMVLAAGLAVGGFLLYLLGVKVFESCCWNEGGILHGDEPLREPRLVRGFRPIPIPGCLWISCKPGAWRACCGTFFCAYCMWSKAVTKSKLLHWTIPHLLMLLFLMSPLIGFATYKLAGTTVLFPLNNLCYIVMLLLAGYSRRQLVKKYNRQHENGCEGCDCCVGCCLFAASTAQMAQFVQWKEKMDTKVGGDEAPLL